MSSFFSKWASSSAWQRPAELQTPQAPAQPNVAPIDGAVPYVDRGMRIPETYGVDVVRALVQDPFRMMVYWEMRTESLDAIAGLFPDGAEAGFRPAMRLTEIDGTGEAIVAIPSAGKYWFDVTPGRRYRVDLGARSDTYGFVPIARSNVVETPRGTVAPTVDEDPRYAVETGKFVRLLQVTGFASDRVLLDVARADTEAATGEPAQLGAAPPAYLVDAFGRLPESVRAAAATVARGQSLSFDSLELLPEQLRHALELLRARGEDEVLTAAFMHLLPQLLRRLLEGELADAMARPFQLPPRFSLGGSEEIRKPHVDWSWMPSMNESLTRKPPELRPDALDPDQTT
jgi:hypothetical protein